MKKYNLAEPILITDDSDTLYSLVQKTLSGYSEKIAIKDNMSSYTYKQIFEWSYQLAHYLLEKGIQKGDTIAIYADRNVNLVISLLAINQIGALFTILDPSYPSQHLLKKLDLVKPKGLIQLTAASVPEEIQNYLSQKTLTLQIQTDTIRRLTQLINIFPITMPLTKVKPDDLAYIAFTSGTTGMPKAIFGTHRPVVHFLKWHSRIFSLEKNDNFSLLSGLGHDPLLRDIFTPLSIGAQLTIPTTETRLNPDELTNWLIDEKISICHLTPSLLRLLLTNNIMTHKKFYHLRYLFFAGEKLLTTDLSFSLQLAPNATSVNFYGATETPQAMSYYICDKSMDLSNKDATIPIGQGIEGVQILIMNDDEKLCDMNELGEIWVRSPYLSKMIVSNSTQTDVFLTNPNTKIQSDCFYKTGDYGHYLPEGSVYYLGRQDSQVKISGYRIELAAIENFLNKNEHIQNSALKIVEDNGEKIIRSYIILKQKSVTTIVGQLPWPVLFKNYLNQQLPEYMVPRDFIIVEYFPLTPTGKIDYAQLPNPIIAPRNSLITYVKPNIEVEIVLAKLWCSLLMIDRAGREDNFFELGGNSQLATRLCFLIYEKWQIKIPNRLIYETATLTVLADKINTNLTNKVNLNIHNSSLSNIFPLSHLQRRLWIVDKLIAKKNVYNLHLAIEFNNFLSFDILKKSLNTLMSRHKILSNRLHIQNQQPILFQDTEITDLPLTIIHATSISSEAQLDYLVKQPFDLEKDLLIRAYLLKITEQRQILLLNLHHIIADGWSLELLCKELSTIYNAIHSTTEMNLPTLSTDYKDFINWQVQDQTNAVQLEYWKNQLAELPELNLNTDKCRPVELSYAGNIFYLDLPQDLTHQLLLVNKKYHLTNFITLLSVFKLILQRYTLQNDIAVGSVFANRQYPQFENMVGMFANTLVLRTELDANMNFVELLQRVQETVLAAQEHQSTPFDQVVDQLKLPRYTNKNPLFQVMFVAEHNQQQHLNFNDLDAKLLPIETHTAMFDLCVSIRENLNTLQIKFEYATDLFEHETIARMGKHFLTALSYVLNNPQQIIANVPLLTSQESQEFIAKNIAKKQSHTSTHLLQKFAEQVQQTPQNIAVVASDKSLTYQQLDQMSNQLARYLQKQGVLAETLVAISYERSSLLIVGILGILKAGGAYLPLDTLYPPERLALMLNDSQAPILLSQNSQLPLFNNYQGKIIQLDNDWQTIQQESDSSILELPLLEQIAYVIYTSGSTGKPKGTLVTHYNVARLFTATEEIYHFNASDSWTLFHSYSFDVSVWEIWGALLYGGKLIVVPYEIARSPQLFYDLLIRENITVLNQTPSAFQGLILYENTLTSLPSLKLRLIIFAGEALELNKLKPWFNNHGEQTPELYNMYGPTETTVVVTYEKITHAHLEKTWRSPLGKTLSDISIYILDAAKQLVPVGVPGEIYIAGDGVGKGYLNSPELTQKHFIPNPFFNTETLYKTGDLGRYLSEGTIDFLGRIDQQVKIRGYRIELGEIQACLCQLESVQTAVVLPYQTNQNQTILVAYIIPKNTVHQNEAISEWRQHLKKHLPDYMIPTAFILVKDFPLTPNGKLATKLLPTPNEYSNYSNNNYIGAQTATEKVLTAIFLQLLPIQRIGREDNFFEYGGNSLLATDLLFKINATYNAKLPLPLFFKSPTIATLANYVDNKITPENDMEAMKQIFQDKVLPPNIVPQPQSSVNDHQNNILLTGSTGFLGAYLLHELLQKTSAKIYCLVRAENIEQATLKLIDNLKRYDLFAARSLDMIEVIVGDLSKPQLGITTQEFQLLAEKIDVIYHNAASVHMVFSYEKLRADNVLGTLEIIKLATLYKNKPIHYISTLSAAIPEVPSIRIANAISQDIQLMENPPSNQPDKEASGYTLTKWVAECLLTEISNRGLKVSIYRPGTILGHSKTGISHTNDSLLILLKGCIQLGFAPDWDMQIAIAPVDYVSQAIVKLSLASSTANQQIFHLHNPVSMSWKTMLEWINDSGYAIKICSENDWQQLLINSANRTNALYPQLPIYLYRFKATHETSIATASANNTAANLKLLKINCPPMSLKILRLYLNYLSAIKFMPFPSEGFLQQSCETSSKEAIFPNKYSLFPQNKPLTPPTIEMIEKYDIPKKNSTVP